MALKDSLQRWLRSGPQAVAVVAAVALVIGALLGLGLGYKIEKSRTQSDVKRLQKEIKKLGGGGQKKKGGAVGQRIGKVTANVNGTLTVTTAKTGSQVVQTTSATKVEHATNGKVQDVTVGRRVLVTPGGAEVLVLPATSPLGRVVQKTSSTSFTIAAGNGAPAGVVKTATVRRVEVASPEALSAIKPGARVLAGGRASTKAVFDAVEIIELPTDSAFGK